MPMIHKANAAGRLTTISSIHMLTEDARPGHNIMYIGQDLNAIDSVSLKPLYGLAGTFKATTSGGSYGGSPQFTGDGNGERHAMAYMMLAGKHPCGYQNFYATNLIANGYNTNNVSGRLTYNMDAQNRKEFMDYKDNGDGTKDVIVHNQSMGNIGAEAYSAYFTYTNLPDDNELYEETPSYYTTHTTTTWLRGAMCGYTALDGSNAGFTMLSNMSATSYPTYPNITQFPVGGFYSAENSYMTGGAANGYYQQFVGMSRADGLPIVLERRHSQYRSWFRIAKWSGSAWTVLLNGAYGDNNNYNSFQAVSTTYTYNNTQINGAGTDTDNNSGTSDSYARYASTWFREDDTDSKYMYMVTPVSYSGVPFFDCIRWDTSTDTFVGAGMQGPSTSYAVFYHLLHTGGNGWETTVDDYVWSPKGAGLTLPTSSFHAGTEQALAYAMTADVHGYTNADGSVETPWNESGMTGNIVPVSCFNSTGVNNAFDSQFKVRSILCASTTRHSTTDYYYYMVFRGATIVPETIKDWVWCDSGKTTIAAMCPNATYIYQCRKGDTITTGTAAGGGAEKFTYDTTTSSSTFNVTVNSGQMGWVHVATIPHAVIQMGIDKHDRLWYVTYDTPGPYYGATDANTKQYHKQMWMLTTQTPHKVNLTGNATTDTITYSGSNIDKTLTIEALNFKGQRIAKTITLTITGTSAQFDNGTQTKDVATSSSATVDETITVTGSGSFNITAAYGA